MKKKIGDYKRHFQNSDEICRYVAGFTDTVIMSFSCGKDSVAAWLQLKNYFKNIVPFFMYLVPGLSFVEDALDYYENFFRRKIIRLPHPAVVRLLNNLVFQAPENCHIVEEADLRPLNYDETSALIAKEAKIDPDTFTAHGTRAADSLMRRTSLKKWGSLNPGRRSFMPIFDWKKADLVYCFRKAKIKLPYDYVMFGRSFDGIDYRFIEPLKTYRPKDYQKILELFPLAELEIKRREWRERYYAKEGRGRGVAGSTVRFIKLHKHPRA